MRISDRPFVRRLSLDSLYDHLTLFKSKLYFEKRIFKLKYFIVFNNTRKTFYYLV